MKWNPFKSRLSDELRKRNEQLGEKTARKKGVFERQTTFFKKLFGLIKVDANIREQVEELFLGLDFGPFLADRLAENVSTSLRRETITGETLKQKIRDELMALYGDSDPLLNIEEGRTNVLVMVGANGSGKTTSIAKLAHYFKERGLRPLIIAGDTFRAGAVEQLHNWSKRLSIDICLPLRALEDPSALVYRSLTEKKDEKYDVIIVDTSGKQHNNKNLLNELNKMIKTIQKFEPSWPNEILLVLDSTIGQTSFLHAEQFLSHSGVTGIILSKMDHMSRGGVIFAIKDRFKIPVKLVGTGEKPEDLTEFDLSEIVDQWISSL